MTKHYLEDGWLHIGDPDYPYDEVKPSHYLPTIELRDGSEAVRVEDLQEMSERERTLPSTARHALQSFGADWPEWARVAVNDVIDQALALATPTPATGLRDALDSVTAVPDLQAALLLVSQEEPGTLAAADQENTESNIRSAALALMEALSRVNPNWRALAATPATELLDSHLALRAALATPPTAEEDEEDVVQFAHGAEPYAGSEYERMDKGSR